VHLLHSRTDEAILYLERARSAAPEVAFLRSWLASAYALKGETARGAAELAEARRLVSDDSYSTIARQKAFQVFRTAAPKVRDLYETTYFAGLRKAGMPEE
jgi:predicted Zn-dependent protease